MYLKRQSESVPKETTFSGTDSALSAGGHSGGEGRVSRHRQQQLISPSSNWSKLVLSDGCVSWANYGDRDERYRGIIVSLRGRFSLNTNWHWLGKKTDLSCPEKQERSVFPARSSYCRSSGWRADLALFMRAWGHCKHSVCWRFAIKSEQNNGDTDSIRFLESSAPACPVLKAAVMFLCNYS